MLFQIKLMESGTVFGGSGRCWPVATAEFNNATPVKRRKCKLFITLLEMIHLGPLEIIADQGKNAERNENCASPHRFPLILAQVFPDLHC